MLIKSKGLVNVTTIFDKYTFSKKEVRGMPLSVNDIGCCLNEKKEPDYSGVSRYSLGVSTPVEYGNVKMSVPKYIKKEVPRKMLDCIVENYFNTEDAVLVDKWAVTLGITDCFISGLIVKDHCFRILAEAKRREEEFKKRCVVNNL